jgi:hypothetical protein
MERLSYAKRRLLQRIALFNNNVIDAAGGFIGAPDVNALARRYEACMRGRHVDMGFNLFAIISDIYHRENLHSDMLKALIDPQGGHGEQEKFLALFLAFLVEQGARINPTNYRQARVIREENKIDLLIADSGSKSAVIVENKINDAGDMPRQIPRYLEYVRQLHYNCDAIVYLRLSGHSSPDTTGWTEQERKTVAALLTVICAYDETPNDLFTGWIQKCEQAARNPDAVHVLSHYGRLLKKLGANVMNKPVMEGFYQIIVEGDNLKTALSLKAMVDDLVRYRVERIIDHFKGDLAPFTKVANWHDDDAYFTGVFWEGAHLGIDVGVLEESYSFLFWDREDDIAKNGRAEAMLQKMNCLQDYQFSDGGFRKTFAFPADEKALYDHIRAFKKALATALATDQSKGSQKRR